MTLTVSHCLLHARSPAGSQSTIGGAASSLSVPYMSLSDASVSEVLPAALKHLSPSAQTVTGQLNAPADCDALLVGCHLGSALGLDRSLADLLCAPRACCAQSRLDGLSVFGNRVADLIMVTSSDVAATDACVSRLTDRVAELSSGNYVALFAADAASPSVTTVRALSPDLFSCCFCCLKRRFVLGCVLQGFGAESASSFLELQSSPGKKFHVGTAGPD